MAINFGAYSQGSNLTTAADEYAGQAAMLPDLGESFQEGVDTANDIQDRELQLEKDAARERRLEEQAVRAQESHDMSLAMNEFAHKQNLEMAEQKELEKKSNRRALLEQNGILPYVENQESETTEAEDDSALITKSSNRDIPGVYENGEWLISDADIASRVKGGSAFRQNKPAVVQAAQTYLETPNLDIDQAGETYQVADAIRTDGYKRGKWNPGTNSYDAVVTVVGENGKKKEVTVPGGDFEAYFGNTPTRTTPVTLFQENKSPVLTKLRAGETVTPQQFESIRNSVYEQFAGQPEKIKSFLSSVGVDDPAVIKAQDPNSPGGAEVTAEEAAEIAMGIAKAQYGKNIVQPRTPTTSLNAKDALATGNYAALQTAIPGVTDFIVEKDDKGNITGYVYKFGKDKNLVLTGDRTTDERIIQQRFGNFEKDTRTYANLEGVDFTNLTKDNAHTIYSIPNEQLQELSPKERFEVNLYKTKFKPDGTAKTTPRKPGETIVVPEGTIKVGQGLSTVTSGGTGSYAVSLNKAQQEVNAACGSDPNSAACKEAKSDYESSEKKYLKEKSHYVGKTGNLETGSLHIGKRDLKSANERYEKANCDQNKSSDTCQLIIKQRGFAQAKIDKALKWLKENAPGEVYE